MSEVRRPTIKEMSVWTEEANTFVQQYLKANYAHQAERPDYLTLEPGRKYARIVRNAVSDALRDGWANRTSAWAFINMENGDVLKAETWNKPAKHARGNIFTHKPEECCDWTGPKYLR